MNSELKRRIKGVSEFKVTLIPKQENGKLFYNLQLVKLGEEKRYGDTHSEGFPDSDSSESYSREALYLEHIEYITDFDYALEQYSRMCERAKNLSKED